MKGCTCSRQKTGLCPQCASIARLVDMALARLDTRAVLTPEKPFMQEVIDLATLYGWKAFHPFWSMRSTPGYPDLTLAKAGQPVIFAECKSETGTETDAQSAWLDTLAQATGTEVYTWRPRDLDAIIARLGRTP